MTEEEMDEVQRKIEMFSTQLCEQHGIDTVQTIWTRCLGKDTFSGYGGTGNVYAREGSVRRWLADAERKDEQEFFERLEDDED